jgi:hypothetical protein
MRINPKKAEKTERGFLIKPPYKVRMGDKDNQAMNKCNDSRY